MPLPPDVEKALEELEARKAAEREEEAREQDRRRAAVHARLQGCEALVTGLQEVFAWAQGPEAREAFARARPPGFHWLILVWPVALGPQGLLRLVVGGGHVGASTASVESLLAHVPVEKLEELVGDMRSGAVWNRIAADLRARPEPFEEGD